MKVSQELAILFLLRRDIKNTEAKATIIVCLTINGERDGFSLGYQVDPQKFDKKSATVLGKSAEVIEINRQILRVRAELLQLYNRLRDQGSIVTPTMLKNAYLGVGTDKKTLLQVIDIHNEKFTEKVEKGKRSDGTLKKWVSTRDKLVAYMKHVHKLPDTPLERIEYGFAEDFFDYLTLTLGLQDNSAMKYLKNTKQLLKLAVQRKWVSRNALEDYACSYVNPERDILDIGEVSLLFSKKIPIPRLEDLLQCVPGLCRLSGGPDLRPRSCKTSRCQCCLSA